MFNWKESITTYTVQTTERMIKQLKRVCMTALAAGAITLAAGSAAYADGSELTTVYYVYMDDEYIGTVSDKNLIEEKVKKQLESLENEYRDLDAILKSQVSFVPEQVFAANANTYDEETADKIKSSLAIKAEASAIVIDGKQIAYLADEKQAEEVLKQIKLSYVSDALLRAVEVNKASSEPLPALEVNQTRVVDVSFTENVSVSAESITPDELMTVKEAVTLLKKGTLEDKKYTVKEGDVLGSIAGAYDLTTKQLLELNPVLKEDSILDIGQQLNVTVLKPYVDVVVEKEALRKEKIDYEKEVIEDSSMFKGDTKVKQEGKEGSRNVTYAITEQNGKQTAKEEVSEEIITKPVKHIVVKGTKVIPSRGDGSFVWPASGGYVSSKLGYRWGKLHKGIDIARPSNRTIKAADNGIVVSAGWDGGYGNKIIIDHQNGYRTVYAHLDSMSVSSGQTVQKGSGIGVMGSTGHSTGIHLHFELYKNGSLQDPLNYVR
ncbi:peptidoglycan DD-metalloendopeptidase family protein [Cytobacillus gottheilii]|uniref:peptidoglycan DD-metalloendopeptidase family protein n=1 Tax=Cytobacillus gottheilii TaxID=859144 RepID=UPI00249437A4|nr:peptidoglycan DD-metalloendopeptidase family protein [Cytobacillus gottheilii]